MTVTPAWAQQEWMKLAAQHCDPRSMAHTLNAIHWTYHTFHIFIINTHWIHCIHYYTLYIIDIVPLWPKIHRTYLGFYTLNALHDQSKLCTKHRLLSTLCSLYDVEFEIDSMWHKSFLVKSGFLFEEAESACGSPFNPLSMTMALSFSTRSTKSTIYPLHFVRCKIWDWFNGAKSLFIDAMFLVSGGTKCVSQPSLPIGDDNIFGFLPPKYFHHHHNHHL